MNHYLKRKHIYRINLVYTLLATIFLLPVMGCSSPKDIIYLSDLQPNITINVQDPRPIKFLPGDKISIQVHSRDKELVEMFNLGSLSGNLTSYTVDENGKIEMPIIGSVHVKGLTRLELQNIIRYKLLASKLVRDPIVTVEYVDLGYYVIGELGTGRHPINRDIVTLMEAISECGDLEISGRRDNITVIRTTEGQQTPYEVNITTTDDLYSSPVYYLQQNDMIYVKPNDKKIDETTPMGSAVRTPNFWISMFNFALSLLLLFTK